MLRISLLLSALLACAGCAYDAVLVVTTSARERCEWPERINLNTTGDRFRVPDSVRDARLRVGEAVFPLAAGTTVEIDAQIEAGRTTIRVTSGDRIIAEAPAGSRVLVQWTSVAERPLSTRQEFPIPDDAPLPWTVDLEVRPSPQHRMQGECRLLDVTTAVELSGPDAAALEFVPAMLPRDGVVKGEVREVGGE